MSSHFSYNIHDIITVSSEVRLPELEPFRTQKPINQPTVRVRIGSPKSGDGRRVAGSVAGHRRVSYDESLGAFGFGAEIEFGDTIEVIASPILRYSPHVLYTNLVEPVLRWTFVEMGYVLVHAACVAFGNDAYLVTAKTDTGKTTTILRILDRQRRATDSAAFVSDDLTLLCPDGRVMTYPKPLTISQHTVAAVNSPLLAWRERFALLYQSRIHSRSGRKFALLLTGTNLPMATINAVTQFVVPPPKYHIQRLIPNVKIAREARLAGIFVIERGGDGKVPLDQAEATEILLSNSDDAYGFPPYHDIKEFLYHANGRDLRVTEREIVTTALQGCPALLLRSSSLDWWRRILTLMNEAEATTRPMRVRPALRSGISPA